MPLEIEAKLRIPTDDSIDDVFNSRKGTARLRSELEPTQMVSHYYDTPSSDISSRRWSLRLRQEGKGTVATLKTNAEDSSGGLFARGEWQVHANSIEEGVDLLIEDGAPCELRDMIGGKPLVEQCRVEFVRRGMVVELQNGLLVNITEDKGELCADNRREPLHELEVEVLFGDPVELEPFVEHLIREYGFERERLSKYERALRLIRSRGSRDA